MYLDFAVLESHTMRWPYKHQISQYAFDLRNVNMELWIEKIIVVR
jgi:hypothetical protein